MTLGDVRAEDESTSGPFVRSLRFIVLLSGVCFLLFAGGFALDWRQQAVLGVVTVLLALWMDRTSTSYLVTLTLIFISIYSTFRYGYWRVGTTAKYLLAHGTKNEWLQAAFVATLILAEGYAAVTLLLGYMQTLWPLRRAPVPLPDDPRDWPTVDLLIPTFNEPLSIVRYTALAAVNIDWPADKLNVYILDDGNREEFRKFAEDAGIGYLTREGNEHAKAGNLNSALRQLSAPFVAVFDCDHVPTRSFLQITLGWFLRDERLGMLQTPQHLYSPDPFDRNLEQFRRIPNEGELFYGIVQDGNDFWNATLFCGSCAVLRRSALDEVGGFAPETLTEDVHTSLRMQMDGWNTAYINIPQAAGLATESLDGHVKQRIRWARGMAQILRIDNPLFARGLTLAQRLCYFSSMFHFLYALPRLIFLVAPLAFLIFGHVILPGSWPAILAFALPHLFLSSVVNSRIQGQHRHPFWNEIYETILAPYILIPTLFAMLRPRSGSFDVTRKGSQRERGYFDGRTAIPFLLLMAFQLTGLVFGAARMVRIPWRPLLWLHHGNNPGAVVTNMVWAFFNLAILGVCASVAWESHQRRSTVRLRMAIPVDVMFADGTLEEGLTADISNSGVSLRIDDVLQPRHGEAVQLIFPVLDGEASLPATVIEISQGVMRAQFDSLTIQEEETLTMVLYSRADTWLGWGDSREASRPFKSMARILGLALRGVGQTFEAAWSVVQPPDNTKFAAGALQAGLLLAVFVGLTAAAAQFRSSQLRRAELKPVSQVKLATEHAATERRKPSGAVTEFVGTRVLPLQNEVPVVAASDNLGQLPGPFLSNAATSGQEISIAFLSEPSPDAFRAAGIVASWFAVQAGEHPVRYPVTFGAIPHNNAVLIVENESDIPQSLHLDGGSGPTVSMRTNPESPLAKLLVVSGSTGSEAVDAARGLALHGKALTGDLVNFGHLDPSDTRDCCYQNQESPQWMALPDLHLFASTGFPFIPRADLSETTVVLPPAITPEVMKLYITIVAQLGAQEAHPLLNVTVSGPDELKSDGTKNYIVLDIGADQPALRTLNPSLPVALDSDGPHPRDPQGFFAPVRHAWWKLRDWETGDLSKIDTSDGLPPAVIEEAEWPAHSGRSVVVVSVRDSESMAAFLAAYPGKAKASDLAGSVSILTGTRFVSYRIGDDVYYAGSRSPWMAAGWVFSEFPWLLILAVTGVSGMMAVVVRTMLRQKAKERLLMAA
ncbi:cellulose synthase catalytic subunit (UDP-forming) [Granulicella aggregans]|uniref:Cellulose synthase catalytic subunit [UDP-forming] n=1 Tax=Granulicella aggregans TaxID=474949 RepID=A0A7W8E611_9BACT|nr:UDP-forming cellulose synthase catalytic subunit [Granulicella aggregans]MBB5059869.1 cellulose synthase catalytic subunit (UDP-forming) [Granulicella aggregans]